MADRIKAQSEQQKNAPSTEKLLIIEDDQFLAKMLSRALQAKGLKTELASSGREGLEKALAQKPRLIILDIILPDVDGFEILKKLKSDPLAKKIPVIIVSNLGQEEDVRQGLNLGARDYIIKSDLSLDEVVVKVKNNLNQ